MNPLPTLEETAFAWAIRAADPAFDDWAALMEWLGGDPARNAAYDHASAIVAEASAAVPPSVVAPGRIEPQAVPARFAPRRRFLVGGLALAAGIAGVLLVTRPTQREAMQVFDAPAGRTRTIALAEGSRVELAGGGRLRVDPARPRMLTLDRGHAVFTVHHREDAPFDVDAGPYRIVDIGTVFEVSRAPTAGAADAAAVRVAVAEGEIVVDPGRMALSLAAGQAADLRAGQAPVVERVAPASVGQWRQDRMTYVAVPLRRVAADLSIALDQPIAVDRSVSERPFNGTISPETLRGRPRDAAALFGVGVRIEAKGWTFHAR